MKQDDNRINIHQNYTLWNLCVIASNSLNTMMSEIMKTTPYGEEYEECYKYFSSKVLSVFHEFERLCRKCQNIQGKEETR